MFDQHNDDLPPTGDIPAEERICGAPSELQTDGNVGIQVIGADVSQILDAFMGPRHVPNISYDIHDSIISSASPLLSSFICQKWPVSRLDHLPTSISHKSASDAAKPDCAVMFSNWMGNGPMFLMHYCILAINCGSVPVLPPSVPGQLPVIVMNANTDVIPFWIFYATLVYFYNHDQSQLFVTVFGRTSCWEYAHLFPAGQRKTSTPPAMIADDILEDIAMCLTQEELELLESHIQGFTYTQLSLDISDLGFQEVILTACTIVNKARSLHSRMFFLD
ncbi:hypothetical protein EDD18DRAFT_1350377 [Armillaria luteobubalina]|uniref:Uncharacterized protein n=1 Tax=Armillaria luteobubalina TaxID=153913 RepID=A0AA39QAU5_9AGAR|nr:hypothetical protein EDD18DRAFT_1350377 [Armillaria luteobubalina]